MSECYNQSGIELGYNGGPTEILRDFPIESDISIPFQKPSAYQTVLCSSLVKLRNWTTCPRAATHGGEVYCCIFVCVLCRIDAYESV